jgi:hypothetical protein
MDREYDREEIIKNAPDFVQIASVALQNKYIDYEIARRNLDECEDRFMRYTNDKGEFNTIDLKNVNIKGIMKNKGANDEAIKDAQEIRSKRILPLISKYNQMRQKYFHAFDLHNKQGNALISLTPMLLDMFGSMLSVKDIVKICKQKEGYDLSEAELVKFYNENKNVIEARQSKYVLKSDQYRVATESGRLEILNDILTDLYLKYEKYMKLDQDQKALVMEREIRNVLEQARKELKGNQLKLTVDGKIDISATLHGVENVGRVMRDVPINSIIIGLVSSKANIPAEVMIQQLSSSWYKNFNGFNKNILGQEEIQLPGDIIKGYDWKELEKKNNLFLSEMSQTVQGEYVEFEELKDVEEKKEDIKARLRRIRGNSKS